MKVSDEWRGHVHDLRRIAEMLERRPTECVERHTKRLKDLADAIEKEAAEYAQEYE